MTINHSAITDPKIHEPKGISTATVDRVYVADGAGSGNWTRVKDLNLNGLEEVVLTAELDNISSASSTWVVAPYAGDIIKCYSVIHGAISGADAELSLEIGGTLVTDSEITVAFTSSAAGDVDSSTPTGNNTVSAGQAIEVLTDGASTGTVRATVTIVLDVS